MVYVVARVVICDAFREPDRHYELLRGGRSKRVETRRPSMRFLASAKDVNGGIAGVVGKEAQLFDDLSASAAELNDSVNQLRDEVRAWREAGYPDTAVVTRRLLEWCTGKTVVMALFVTWATLHKRKVSGSSLSANFLVLVPNLTVRDRVSGQPGGDGLDPAGEHNLYDAFEMAPPEYREEFHPNVLVRNWQGIPLENKREDWIGEGEVPLEEGRFIQHRRRCWARCSAARGRTRTRRSGGCSAAGISPEMAVRLSMAFDTSAESWINQQTQYDLWHAEQGRKRLRVMRLAA